MRHQHEIRVGLLVISALLAGYLALAWLTRSAPFASENQLVVIRFDNVNGLLPGDVVVWRGVQVGKVTQIVPQSDAVRVTVALSQSVDLREDASANLQVKELMGGKQIDLNPGQGAQPLAAGREVPGRTSMDFSTSFSTFSDMAGLVNPDDLVRMRQMADTLYRLTLNMGQALDPAQVRALMAQTAALLQTTQALAQEARRMDVLQQTDSVLRQTSRLAQSGQATLQSVSGKADTLIPQLENTLAAANSLLTEASRTLEAVNQTPAMEWASRQESFDRIDATLTELQTVLRQIQQDKIYVGLKLGKGKKASE